MSKIGLSRLNNLNEISDASLSLNNLFVQTKAYPPIQNVTAGTGGDIGVFNGNLNTTTIFTYLPSNISFSVQSSNAYTGYSRYIYVDNIINIPYSNLSFNITVGDAISADNIYFKSEYTVSEIIPETVNNITYYKLIFANNKSLEIPTMPYNTPITFIKRNSQANIQNDLFILGSSTTTSFTQNDIVDLIYYTFDTTRAPLLSSDVYNYYIVDYQLNTNNQVCFGLSKTQAGTRVSLSGINALSAVNFVRNTAVTQRNFLNIVQPTTKDSSNIGKTYPYTTVDTNLNNAIVELENNASYISGIIPKKLVRTTNNVIAEDIHITGVLKVDDPNLVNKNTVSNDAYSPSIYILDNTGDFNTKKRIYSNSESPWLSTFRGLSATKDLTVDGLAFEHGISIDKVTINTVSIPQKITTATIKIPITIINSDNTTSIYYAFASLNPV